MSLFSTEIGDHKGTAGTVSNLTPVSQTKKSLRNNNYFPDTLVSVLRAPVYNLSRHYLLLS